MRNAAKFFEVYDLYCWCKNPVNGYALLTEEEYNEMLYFEGEYQAEHEAETAWLRHAEMTTIDDMAFEQWERERCYY